MAARRFQSPLYHRIRFRSRSEEHTSELQSPCNLVCRLLLEKKKKQRRIPGPKTPVGATPCAHRMHACTGCVWLYLMRCSVRSVLRPALSRFSFFFFNDTATTEIYTLSLHDALPISVYWYGVENFPSRSASRPVS